MGNESFKDRDMSSDQIKKEVDINELIRKATDNKTLTLEEIQGISERFSKERNNISESSIALLKYSLDDLISNGKLDLAKQVNGNLPQILKFDEYKKEQIGVIIDKTGINERANKYDSDTGLIKIGKSTYKIEVSKDGLVTLVSGSDKSKIISSGRDNVVKKLNELLNISEGKVKKVEKPKYKRKSVEEIKGIISEVEDKLKVRFLRKTPQGDKLSDDVLIGQTKDNKGRTLNVVIGVHSGNLYLIEGDNLLNSNGEQTGKKLSNLKGYLVSRQKLSLEQIGQIIKGDVKETQNTPIQVISLPNVEIIAEVSATNPQEGDK